MFLLPYGNIENQEIPISISAYTVNERSLSISNNIIIISGKQNVELESINLSGLINSECKPILNKDALDIQENGFDKLSDPWFTIIKSDFQLPAGLTIVDGNNITGTPTEAGNFENEITIRHTYTKGDTIAQLDKPINIKFEIAAQENIEDNGVQIQLKNIGQLEIKTVKAFDYCLINLGEDLVELSNNVSPEISNGWFESELFVDGTKIDENSNYNGLTLKNNILSGVATDYITDKKIELKIRYNYEKNNITYNTKWVTKNAYITVGPYSVIDLESDSTTSSFEGKFVYDNETGDLKNNQNTIFKLIKTIDEAFDFIICDFDTLNYTFKFCKMNATKLVGNFIIISKEKYNNILNNKAAYINSLDPDNKYDYDQWYECDYGFIANKVDIFGFGKVLHNSNNNLFKFINPNYISERNNL